MQKDSILTALFRGIILTQLIEFICIYWWRRRELNQHPYQKPKHLIHMAFPIKIYYFRHLFTIQ